MIATPFFVDFDLCLFAEGSVNKGYLQIISEIGASACTPSG
jgi:hypothetical protein